MSDNYIDSFDKDKTKEINNDSVKTPSDLKEEDAPADFNQAIEAAGFGLYNVILLLLAISAQFGSMFESSTMSYILPIAECDLHLTLNDKGILNAVGYAGMTISAIVWGYLADTKGRRNILLYGYLVDALCVFGSALSQNFMMLVTFKFLGGLVVNGPAAVLFTYLTEMHGPKQTALVVMIVGMITSSAMLALPLLAWAIFPQDWHFRLFNSLEINTWQIYLFVCGLPSLISGLILLVLPESPRFLMGQGRNEEALRTFRKIYYFNTRKPKDTYPVSKRFMPQVIPFNAGWLFQIKSLIQELPDRKSNKDEAIFTVEPESKTQTPKPPARSFIESLRSGMQQMKPLFHKPLLLTSLQCYTMQLCIFLGMNTIRLWLPQLFASTAEYEALHAGEDDVSSTMCTILEYSVNKTADTMANHENICSEPINISIDMYMNNIIVSATGFVGYFFAGSIVRVLGAKRLLTYGLFIAGLLGFALYFSVNSLMTLIVSSLFQTVTVVSVSSLMGAVVALFPTQLRSLVVAVCMMCGRLGALSGNLLFPIFVQIGCMPPFVMVAAALLLAGTLSIFVPNPSKASTS